VPARGNCFRSQLLAKYMEHPENFFVVSSDFCHWGQRFSFTWSNPKLTAIHKSIESLDYMGMELIEAGDPAGFTAYLAQFGNTICGRHPIGVLLALLAARGSGTHVTKFVRYEQSSQCKKMTDSSVSYASAVVFARAGR
jgi:AmmeMemoRadiSam system protein B